MYDLFEIRNKISNKTGKEFFYSSIQISQCGPFYNSEDISIRLFLRSSVYIFSGAILVSVNQWLLLDLGQCFSEVLRQFHFERLHQNVFEGKPESCLEMIK